MNEKDFIEDIEKIHSVCVSTVDENGEPSSRIIDMMYIEDNCLFFLTARGKRFYNELKQNNCISITCMKNFKSYTLKGYVKQVNHKYLDILFNKNRYMCDTYPENTRDILEVFKIYKWQGEFFDISSLPINRQDFSYNMENIKTGEYYINDKCINCKKCIKVCPQKCIKYTDKAEIMKEHCLRCGACKEICPVDAIEQK